ncbi:MAG: hypothetical protein H6548_06130 [Chitinophagales bacterium]|nr:hypothetical protein [Chitinophagales bacterium]
MSGLGFVADSDQDGGWYEYWELFTVRGRMDQMTKLDQYCQFCDSEVRISMNMPEDTVVWKEIASEDLPSDKLLYFEDAGYL